MAAAVCCTPPPPKTTVVVEHRHSTGGGFPLSDRRPRHLPAPVPNNPVPQPTAEAKPSTTARATAASGGVRPPSPAPNCCVRAPAAVYLQEGPPRREATGPRRRLRHPGDSGARAQPYQREVSSSAAHERALSTDPPPPPTATVASAWRAAAAARAAASCEA